MTRLNWRRFTSSEVGNYNSQHKSDCEDVGSWMGMLTSARM
jgi:hypothetical protein